MSLFNKVVWSEGMFLRPQHFQQLDRYFEHLFSQGAVHAAPYSWGLSELRIDRDLLKTGKFAVHACRGVLPDGTRFDVPDEAPAPEPLDLSEKIEDTEVFLCLPVRDSRGKDIRYGSNGSGLTRYAVEESTILDACQENGAGADVQIARLAFKLMLGTEERSAYHCIPLARIIQVTADKNVLFDEQFIPPCLDVRVSPVLTGFLHEISGLLHQRGESLAGRVSESGRGGSAEIADFLMLQAINRSEPLVAHFARIPSLHPEVLYRELIAMAGELATFSEGGKRPQAYPQYRHDALKETYSPVIESLRQSLSRVFERLVVSIPLEEKKFGIRVALIRDKSLLEDATFVLAVNADLPEDEVRRNFPAMVKIGPVEQIRDLVNKALPGIGLNPLPVAPRQIPFHAGFTYFALDTKGAIWNELKRSGGLALHAPGTFPGLELALWAIRR